MSDSAGCSAVTTRFDLSPGELAALNREMESWAPERIIEWMVETFGQRAAMQTSMQKTGGVLMHMVSRIAPGMVVLFVDTGVLFPETLELRDEFARRYNLNIRTLVPRMTMDQMNRENGRELWRFDDQHLSPGYQRCCELRKEEPFLEAVRGNYDAVAGGLTRDQGGARGGIQVLGPDPRFGGIKVHPLAYWTEQQVADYAAGHDLPIHPLYARGYTSIGCSLCTTPTRPGEPKRAGRWRHIREMSGAPDDKPLYCGINFGDRGSGI